MAFTRYFSDDALKKLQEEPLFQDFLRQDIVENGTVFPAVRKGRIDFYFRGGKLFAYNGNEFLTHKKYASVLDYSKDYITEADLEDVPPIRSFTKHYERIKENCAAYTKDEAESVSHLCNRFSCAKNAGTEDVVVLDIEVSFENRDDDKPDTNRMRSRQDRIDILLYNTPERELRFFEAKLFSNKEIRAESDKIPGVVHQVERYRAQLKNNEKRILAQYSKHVKAINELFGTNLLEPESLDLEPRLYVFGFDNDQKTGGLKQILNALREQKILVYAKGKPESVVAENLWNKAT